MNWLQKLASVTFSLEGSHKISQPKDIMGLSYELQKYASEKAGFYIDYHSIAPDGDYFSEMEGVINWYVSDNIPEEQQVQIIQQWIQEMQLMDYEMKFTGPEISGMTEDPENPIKVYRIHVLKNGSEDYLEIPEMNLANTNAEDLMRSLGLEFDWTGSIDLQELKTKLEMFTPWDQQELIREPTQEGDFNEPGPVVYDGGRSEDQVSRYIDGLGEIVDFGLQNGFRTLVWY